MRIAILSRRDVHGPGLLESLERRAERLLGRIGERISELAVALADLNGPKGGIDAQCQVQARLHDGRTVIVRARSENFAAAIDLALQKLASRLLKQRKKAVEARRHALPFGRLAAGV